MPTIEVDADTYEELVRHAAVRQTSVAALVAPALHRVVHGEPRVTDPAAKLSPEAFGQLLDSMAVDVVNPPPPEITYSREDIYFDHD